MNITNQTMPIPSTELPPGMLQVAPGSERPTAILTADRLYQLAALTAGAFLLATLL
ncbi:MAG: hypothetical protein WDN23_20135 [Edaphobacter sp.]